MSARPNVGASVVSSREDAERRLLDTIRERPSFAERLSLAIATRRNLASFVVVIVCWLLVNQALLVYGGIHVDPFPFRGLQRALVGVSVAIAMMAARASAERGQRIERIAAAQRDFEEAVRWAATSRQLRVLGRTACRPD